MPVLEKYAFLPKTCKEARELGKTQYFTGKPCPKGHIAPRLTSIQQCVECKRERVNAYNKSAKGKEKEAERRNRPDNLAKRKEYRDSEHGKKLRKKLWSEWYANNKGVVAFLGSKKRAKELRRVVEWADADVIKEIYTTARAINRVVDHVVPLRGKNVCGLHTHNNLAIVSHEHNASKSNKFNDADLGPMVYSANRRMFFHEVANLIIKELIYQRKKHGPIEQAPHEAGTWLLLIEDELREAKQALIKGGNGRDTWTMELVQVAALCVAALEQHGMTNKEGRAI